MDMGRGEERVRYMESNMETYITICKIGSQWEFVCVAQETQTGALYQSRGVGREIGGRFRREGIYVYL